MSGKRHHWRPSLLVLLLAVSGPLGGCVPRGPENPVSAGREWAPGPGLMTRWGERVTPEAPLSEYPRPQMAREDWINLNGLWELAVVPDSGTEPTDFPDRILVPFPVESTLSGVGETVLPSQRVWYRRTFSLPGLSRGGTEEAEGTRWLLHFGAVDWEAEVFLNGRLLGSHRGGYDPFTFDVTEALLDAEEQVLTVAVRDPTDEGDQPRGKQVLDPHGIWYTAVTGIWQTVWLEPVPGTYVERLAVVPDLSGERATVRVEVLGDGPEPVVTVAALQDGTVISRASGRPGELLSLPIPDPRPWSPDDPFLYDLRVSLSVPGDPLPTSTGGPSAAGALGSVPAEGDQVSSYFGMRSVEVGTDARGHPRLFLNGEPAFLLGLLDQGWWPDGLYTAPSDEALREDIVKSREMGFNLIRKHVKVEPARWYYHADREGIVVWQDMPSGDNATPEAREEFALELERVVTALGNHPSIVMWVPFNEGWGQHETERYASWLKSHDPSRMVDPASGWTDEGGGDVLDVHRYPGPGAPEPEDLVRSATPAGATEAGQPLFPELRVAVLGEFGGLGLPLPGHTWVEEENWGYRSFENLEDLNRAYRDLIFQLRPLIGEGLAAAVYTQTTDVEVEVNGMMTYDRRVVKLSEASAEMNRSVYGPPPRLREVLPTSREVGQLWSFTEEDPGEGWFGVEYDASKWREGPGGFGTNRTPGARVGTPWESSDLWLRRSFRLDSLALGRLQRASLYLRIHHDEDAEIYLNGVRIASLEGYTTGYRLEPMDRDAAALLREGLNVVALHVSQTSGGQFIDAGIVEWMEGGG
jgi:hypothetical protein